MKDIEISKEYKTLHDKGFFKGKSILQHRDEIKNLIDKTQSKTILDFGSGKGEQYKKYHLDKEFGVNVSCYDPCVEEFSALPNCSFDGVICTDVFEHISEESIDETFNLIKSRAKKFIFLGICTRAAKKKFSNGQNVHLTIKPLDWWVDRLLCDDVNLVIKESI